MKRHLHKWALALLRLGRLCLKGTVNSARDVAKTGAGMTDGCPRSPLSHGSRDHLRMFARPKTSGDMWASVLTTARVRRGGRQLGRSGRGIGSSPKYSALTRDRLLVPAPDVPPASRGKRPNGSISATLEEPGRPITPLRLGRSAQNEAAESNR